MDQKKVTDYLFLIKDLIDSQESLDAFQCKVDSILETITVRNLFDYPTLITRLYERAEKYYL